MIATPPPSHLRPSAISTEVMDRTVERLVQTHGVARQQRIRRGVAQAAARWWPEDGDGDAFAAFCEASFEPDEAALERSFQRLEQIMEQVDGHLHEVRREVLAPLEIDRGPGAPITAVDHLLVRLDLAPHVDEDLFAGRIAFFALLNFPIHTLRERLAESAGWERAAWARSRMMDRFASRVPAAVAQAATRANTTAEEYVTAYHIRMDRVVTTQGERLFPEGLRLISHWGLRDELRARYSDSDRDAALLRQRLIFKVMERIIRQEIPAAVIDNPDLSWDPESNTVRRLTAGADADADLAAPEADRRYARLLAIFKAHREVDPYTPTAPSLPARRFELDRQMPEDEFEALLLAVLEAPEIDELARLIARRLGRGLEPFDIWYPGFKSGHAAGSAASDASDGSDGSDASDGSAGSDASDGVNKGEALDARVRAVFPSAAAFQAALPAVLARLGFSADQAAWLAARIVVDRARGAGHALGPQRHEDNAHLRTRVGDGGMDYQGYNVAMHELGHNVEQVFSLHGIDHWWLAGVPNNAFTEAFAFMFQERDLEILRQLEAADQDEGPPADDALRYRSMSLASLWNTYEIAGVSLVDMRVWRWLYGNPDATPAALREAVLGIAREVWNRHFAPRLGHLDCDILAIYSHMIAYSLYLPDYALGHIVAFQLVSKLRLLQTSLPGSALGAELERIARQGHLTPDAWMRGAVGGPISAAALLDAARQALE